MCKICTLQLQHAVETIQANDEMYHLHGGQDSVSLGCCVSPKCSSTFRHTFAIKITTGLFSGNCQADCKQFWKIRHYNINQNSPVLVKEEKHNSMKWTVSRYTANWLFTKGVKTVLNQVWKKYASFPMILNQKLQILLLPEDYSHFTKSSKCVGVGGKEQQISKG